MISCLGDTTLFNMSGLYCQKRDGQKRACGWERAYWREHRIAESLQRVLLRTSPSETLPSVSVEAVYEAALEEATVGGDSFDTFALTGGRVALVVVDASGKGLAAAERVAEVRFALRAFLREHRDPGYALSCLNDFVCDSQHLGQRDDSAFATLTLVVLDCASGEAVCLCAGGEPPLVLRADGTVELLQTCGAALGLLSGQEYGSARTYLGTGDTVLLVTDGLTEARRQAPIGLPVSHTGPFLGLEGIAHLATQAWDPAASLYQISRAIFEGARDFSNGSFQDDVCLLVGRRQVCDNSR